MTTEELEQLPEQKLFTYKEEISADGKKVVYSIMAISCCMFQGEDDVILFQDTRGHWWTTGWIDGVLYKRSM